MAIGICALFALSAAAQDKKVDPTGTWSWTSPGRGGGPDRKTTLKLKLEGEKLTGLVITAGRQGGDPVETAIENGKLKGDEISFSVTREFNNNKFTTKYSGKISGDTIKGKTESERGGQTQSRDWEAKREAEKK
jgi:hypothetical protein